MELRLKQIFKKASSRALSFSTLALLICGPLSTDKVDYRQIASPIAVSLQRFSLPYAALEDDHLDDAPVASRPQKVWQVVALRSGVSFQTAKLNARLTPVEWAVAKQPIRPQGPLLILPEEKPDETPRVLELKPLVLSKMDVNVAKLLPVELPSELKPARVLARHIQTQPPSAPREVVLRPEVRRMDELGFHELADHLVREERAWRSEQLERPTPSTDRVIVSLPKQGQQAPPIAALKGTRSAVSQPDEAWSEGSGELQAAAVVEPQVAPQTLHRLNGTFEFTEGLAFTSPDQTVRLQRYRDGVPVEEGQVHVRDGQFAIEVGDESGQLIAKLLDETGEVIGRGELALPASGALHIPMRLVEGVKGAVISAYSFGRTPIYEPDAYVTIDSTSSEMMSEKSGQRRGFFEDPTILPGSSFVARAEKQGFWGTVAMASSEEALTVPLFPTSMVKALIKESGVRDTELAERKGVIWGRVLRDGKPVSGAVVQLDGFQSYRPVYFYDHLLIVDPDKTSTGANGYFALVHVDPGLRTLQVRVPGEAEVAQNVVVDGQFVSHLNFEVARHRSAEVEVSDAFQFDRHLPSFVRWNDSNDVIQLKSQMEQRPRIPLWGGTGLMYLETDAGQDYLPSRQVFSPSAGRLHATPVRADWVRKVAEDAGIRMEAEQGIVFGLLEGPKFEAFMDDTIAYSNANRVYFNAKGEITPRGERGGGFVFFNVPPGARTIGVQADGAKRYGLRVVPVESGQVNVIHYQIPAY